MHIALLARLAEWVKNAATPTFITAVDVYCTNFNKMGMASKYKILNTAPAVFLLTATAQVCNRVTSVLIKTCLKINFSHNFIS